MDSAARHPSPSPGILLHQLRAQAHLSQFQFSRLLLLSRQTYSAYERGERPIPDEVWDRVFLRLAVPVELRTEIDALRFHLSSEEKNLLSGFRRLDTAGQRQVLSSLSNQIRHPAAESKER